MRRSARRASWLIGALVLWQSWAAAAIASEASVPKAPGPESAAPNLPGPETSGLEAPASAAYFLDSTAQVGLEAMYWNGMTGERFINEVLGGGGALFDFDRDGDLDLFMVQGQLQTTAKAGAEPTFPPPAGPLRGRLFRSDKSPKSDGKSPFVFVDVTEESGLDARGYGMGALAGDVDNDGLPDLYVLNYGANQLWRNLGGGRFEERSVAAGVADKAWSTTGAFLDYDEDGWLDLFVGNYLRFELAANQPCSAPSGRADYCGPASFKPAADRLYRNLGDGRFEEVTAKVGMAGPRASALGSVTLDANSDGLLDLFVANDGMANHLWLQRTEGGFEESALLAGCAVNADGASEASMGVDAGDVDGDGDEDLFMAHLDQETHTLYLGDEAGFFEDASDSSGLGVPSFAFTGFGSRLIDVNNDGWLDLLVVNGAIKYLEALERAGDPYPLHQRDQLFLNRGNGRFREVTTDSSPALAQSAVSRGLAAGDLDNDGDVDALVFNNNGPLRVLLNQRGQEASWIGLEIWHPALKRPALGSLVTVKAGNRMLRRRVRSDGSYASGQDSRLIFGLGSTAKIEQVRVHWHGGDVEVWTDLETGRYHRLLAGSGKPVAVNAKQAAAVP